MKTLEYDLVAVGGGTAGLVSAAGASYLGLEAALVEKEALGGDCLWTGCVPSKALIASARRAHGMRHAREVGLQSADPAHSFQAVMERMRAARRAVARHDDPERFRSMGVGVHFGAARFLDPETVEVEGVGRIRSPRIVLATGARVDVPPVERLEPTGYLTHETAFDQHTLPSSLIILGGGPVGLEFAQVYARLGARVTVVEMLPEILPREDPDVSGALREMLRAEGIVFRTGQAAAKAAMADGQKTVTLKDGSRLAAEEIFVATGRKPAVEGLDLDRAGVEVRKGGVVVDDTLRTRNRKVWAAGDVTGGLQFTHVADYMARTVVRDAIFPFPTKVDYDDVPWVTFTDPEVAHVGMGQEDAEARGASTYAYEFAELDRAIADGDTRGFVKISADGKGRILGATILGQGAGELIMPLVLAKQNKLSLATVSEAVFPYPTRVEGVKRAADAYQRARLQGRGGQLLKKVVSWLT